MKNVPARELHQTSGPQVADSHLSNAYQNSDM